MTRDEAIEIELKHLKKMGMDPVSKRDLATANIDALIELGLLKVDEPETALRKAEKLLEARFKVGNISAGSILKDFEKAGISFVCKND